MRIHIEYTDKHGASLIREYLDIPVGHASEQELREYAKEHFETLNLSQRCAAAVVSARVFTIATNLKF